MTYDDSMTEPKRRDKAATKTALLEAARRRFADHGYDGTGVRDIATDADVDPALIFRYFGSKRDLFTEALSVDVPPGLGDGLAPADLAATLAREVVFTGPAPDGDHPLMVMLRSAGRPDVRESLRDRICNDYLADTAAGIDTPDAALRAELIGALLLGMGVMRSVIGTPELAGAEWEQVRGMVTDASAALAGGAAPA